MRGRKRGRNDPARDLTRLENSVRVTHERVLRHSGAAFRVAATTAAASATRRMLRWWGLLLLLLLLLLLRKLRHGYAMTSVLYRRHGIPVGLNRFRRELVLDHQPGGRRRVVKRQPGQVDTGRNDAFVVIRIDADQILFQVEGVLAVLFVL